MEKAMEQKYKLMARIWGMLNEIRKTGYSDSSWEYCTKEAKEINQCGDPYIEEVILAVVGEAERMSKMEIPERRKAYKIAASAFTKAWELYKNLMELPEGKEFSCDGIRLLVEYETAHQNGAFSIRLGNAVYKDVCKAKYGNGRFVPDLMDFYEKYADGIDEANMTMAYEEAEEIISDRPEFTLHVTDLLAGLKKRALRKAA